MAGHVHRSVEKSSELLSSESTFSSLHLLLRSIQRQRHTEEKQHCSVTMVAYGSTLRRARRPGWEDAYLDYDSLRSLLEEIESLCDKKSSTGAMVLPPGYETTEQMVDSLEEKFILRLRKEIEKVSLFTLSRQGEIAEAVGSLRFSDASDLKIQPSISRLPKSSMDDEDDGLEDIETSESYEEEAALLPRGSIVTGPLKTPKPLPKSADAPSRPMFRGDVVLAPMRNKSSKTDEYTALGVELLHLLKFVCVNAMGFRKILKKHDKVMQQADQMFAFKQDEDDKSTSERHRLVGGPEDHLQQLAGSSSVAAIYSSLLAELVDLETAEMGGTVDVYQAIEEGDASNGLLMEQMKSYPVSLVRFKCTVSSIHTLREYAQRVNQPFQAFLSSKAMILTGNDPGGLERATQKALSLLVRFQPDSLLLMDEFALADWERRVVSRSGEPEDDASIGNLDLDLESWGGVNSTSMIINLLSTLLYTVRFSNHLNRTCARRYLRRVLTVSCCRSTITLWHRQPITTPCFSVQTAPSEPLSSALPRLQPFLPHFCTRFGTPKVHFDLRFFSLPFVRVSETCFMR